MITVDILKDLLTKHKWDNVDLYDGIVGGDKYVGKGKDPLFNDEEYLVFIDLGTIEKDGDVLVTVDFRDSSRIAFKDFSYLKRQFNLEKKATMPLEEVDNYLYQIDSYLNQKYNINERVIEIVNLIETLSIDELEALGKEVESMPESYFEDEKMDNNKKNSFIEECKNIYYAHKTPWIIVEGEEWFSFLNNLSDDDYDILKGELKNIGLRLLQDPIDNRVRYKIS